MTPPGRLFLSTVCCLGLLAAALPVTTARALEIEPFRTVNRSPLLQGYGLPDETTPALLQAGSWGASLAQDVASNYTVSSTTHEQILLDGEQYRWTLTGRYGLTDRLEVGLELPVVLQGGGFLDSFIIDWHRFWGLPQGGRDSAPHNRLLYRYVKDGVQRLNMTHAAGGLGDISLLAGYRLYEQRQDEDHDLLAIRTQLKLPTGNSNDLLGSGSVDLAIFLTGSMNRSTEWGTLGLFASAGGMVSSNGEILKQQRNNLIGFGAAGIGWAPASWIAFKVQTNLNSPFYRSSLDELGTTAVNLTGGGTLKLLDNYLLDIAVGEDVAVATAPDVTFHLGLSKRF